MCAWNENPVKAILGMQYQPTRDVLLLRQDWGLDGDPLPPHGRGLLGLIETRFLVVAVLWFLRPLLQILARCFR